MDIETLRNLLVDPRGHELEIGFFLLEMQEAGEFPGGHRSLRAFVAKELRKPQSSRSARSRPCPDYSTFMRWVKAAGSLQGPDDPRAAWRIHRLLGLLAIEDEELRESFIAEHDVATMHVRDLRAEIARFMGQQEALRKPTRPHEATAGAVRRALERAGIDPAAAGLRITEGRKADGPGAVRLSAAVGDPAAGRALSIAGAVLEEIATARSVWPKCSAGSPEARHESLPLEEVDALGPGPVQVRWASRDLVEVTKAETVIARIPVKRESVGRLLKEGGNRKSAGVTPILGSIRLGCLRRATGFAKCELPCYQQEGESRGCFSNSHEYAIQKDNQEKRYDVAHNGLVNDLLSIRLPSTGSASLRRYTKRSDMPRPLFLRVDGESADGAMSIALGIMQMWAEANPQALFTTICSHAVWPSDTMLHWLASLPNAWVGHTVSAWFDSSELNHRFACIERFLDFGIPSAIWISTFREWDNAPVVERALKLVPPNAIIEYPLKADHKQELPLLRVNPHGACGDHRQDRMGRWFTVKWRPDANGTVERPHPVRDGHAHTANEPLKARCRGCTLKCGFDALRVAGQPGGRSGA